MDIKKRLKYSKVELKQALEAIKGGMPVKRASKVFGIPKTTLLYKARGKYPVDKRPGPATVLSENEESELVRWILFVAKRGFPVTKSQLLDSVSMLVKQLKKDNIFNNNRPGRHWYDGFMRRHPELACRVSQNLTHSRASVTQMAIEGWFSEVGEYFSNKKILEIQPNRVYNCDETAFFLSPKENRVIVKKGDKGVYNFINNDEKECITTLIMANAAGDMPPPMIMFNYKRIPFYISKEVPEGWGIGRSDSGWMTGESFYEYIANVFYPWLLKNDIELPIILFVDGHSSHLTMALSDFCIEKKIELIALYPNATHMLQPMDVALFHPLKAMWKKIIHNWRMENCGNRLKREHFGPLLERTLNSVNCKEILINGFRACGLCPFNKDAINFDKIPKYSVDNQAQEKQTNIDINMLNKHLDFFETIVGSALLDKFKTSGVNWTGDIKDEGLFKYWQKIITLKQEHAAMTKDKEEVEEEIAGVTEGSYIISEEGTLVLETSIESDLHNIGAITEENMEFQDNLYEINANEILDVPEYDEQNTIDLFTFPTVNQSECAHRKPFVPIDNVDNPLISSQKNMDSVMQEDQTPKENNDPYQELQKTPPISEHDENFNIPENVPTPFKKSLFWPQTPELTTTTRKRKEKIPSVATSENWRMYHKKREDQKKEKEQKKIERRKKLDAKKNKVNKKVVGEEKSEEAVTDEDGEKINFDNLTIGQYVVARYENEMYPGEIIDKNNDEREIKVKVMKKSGAFMWKWPVPDDILWYPENDVLETIKKPVLQNKRFMFNIPEMKKYI